MNIGFSLFKEFGKYAEELTAQDILNALESESDNVLTESRDEHWCIKNSSNDSLGETR